MNLREHLTVVHGVPIADDFDDDEALGAYHLGRHGATCAIRPDHEHDLEALVAPSPILTDLLAQYRNATQGDA